MKKLIMPSLVSLLLLFSVGSFNSLSAATPSSTIKGEEMELKLDLGNITNKSQKEIEQMIHSFIDKNLKGVPTELQCKVSVSGKVDVGVAEFEITVEVSGPCSEVRAKGKQIANQLLNDVIDAIKDAF